MRVKQISKWYTTTYVDQTLFNVYPTLFHNIFIKHFSVTFRRMD